MDKTAPAAVNEVVLMRHFPRDAASRDVMSDATLADARHALQEARVLCEKIVDVSNHPDPTSNPAANALRAFNKARDFGAKAAEKIDSAVAKLAEEIAKIEKATFSPAPPRDAVAAQLESEVRSCFLDMDDKERHRTITEALNAGNDTIVGAVLRGPAMLTGFSAELLEGYRKMFRQKRYTAELDRAQRLGTALGDMTRAGTALVSFVAEFDGPMVQRAFAAQELARKGEAA
jgi:hypothetical protein